MTTIAAELFYDYRVTAVFLAVTIIVTVVSHVRRTRAVRTLTLLVPTYVAAYEACNCFALSLRCRGVGAPPLTWLEQRYAFRMYALASVIAIVATWLAAAALVKWCRAGVAGPVSWVAVCAVPPLVSVLALWIFADQFLLMGPQRP